MLSSIQNVMMINRCLDNGWVTHGEVSGIENLRPKEIIADERGVEVRGWEVRVDGVGG